MKSDNKKNKQGNLKVFVSTQPFASVNPEPLDILAEHNLNVELNQYGRKITQQELKVHIAGKHALIAGTEKIDKSVLDCCPELKIIARVGIGLDNISFDEVKRRDILLTYTPQAVSQAVAELTVANMLNLARLIPQIHMAMKAGKWNRLIGFELAGKKIGIIGFGRVGQRVAKMLQGFSCELLVNDIAFDEEAGSRYGVRFCTKEQIYAEADIITLHIPRTQLTMGMVDKSVLKQIRNDACLINTSRGGIVNEDDLYNALKDKGIQAAAVDVYEVEPYISQQLCELDNVILTAHSGSCSQEARCLMELAAAREVTRFFSGQTPLCPVPDDVIQMERSVHTESSRLEWHEILNQSGERNDQPYITYRKRWCQYPTHGIVGPYPLNVDIELVRNPVQEYRNSEILDYFLSRLHPDAFIMKMPLFQKIIDQLSRIPEPIAVKLGWRGCVTNHPHLAKILKMLQEANVVEIIISLYLSQLKSLPQSLLDAIVEPGLHVLNVYVDVFEEQDIPFDVLTEIKKRKTLRRIVWPKIRAVGKINPQDSNATGQFADFWGHWADVVALAEPLDSARKVSRPGWDRMRLWQRLMISAQGNIIPSCFDIDELFCLGHFPEMSIQEAWLGDKMNKLRQAEIPDQNGFQPGKVRLQKKPLVVS